jgi:hypothetical protein
MGEIWVIEGSMVHQQFRSKFAENGQVDARKGASGKTHGFRWNGKGPSCQTTSSHLG